LSEDTTRTNNSKEDILKLEWLLKAAEDLPEVENNRE